MNNQKEVRELVDRMIEALEGFGCEDVEAFKTWAREVL